MKELEQRIKRHLVERGWDHLKPADIAKSIMIEGAELLELFQWENLELEAVKKDHEKMEQIKKELADVFIYALDMSVLLELDTQDIIHKKLDHVEQKYPAALMRKISAHTPGGGADAEYWRIKKEHRAQGEQEKY